MKNLTLLLILFTLLSGCSMNRYLLTDDGTDEEYLIGVIKELAEDGQISKKPIIVVDLTPHIFKENMREYRLPISKDMIGEIWTLEKYAGEAIYGPNAEGGVIVINTLQFLADVNNTTDYNKVLFLLETHKQNDDNNVLILLDDKEIQKEELDKLNLNELEYIRLVKDPAIIEKYSGKGYSKIFILHR